jgi:hypothetical protein
VDLRTLLTIVVRRWIVEIPTIVVAVLVGQHLLGSVKPDYEAKGSLLLLSPTKPPAAPVAPGTPAVPNTAPGAIDPYQEIVQSLDRAALVFSTVMNDGAQKKVIASQGLTSNYTVTVDKDAPILLITATDKRSRVAVETVKAVLDAIPLQIARRETLRAVAPNVRIVPDVLSTPVRANALNAAKTRALVAFIALGLAAVLSVALLVESWAQSAQNRRDRRRLTVAVPGPAAAPARANEGDARERAGPRGEDEPTAANDDEEAQSTKRTGRARAKPRRRSDAAS